MYCLGVCAWMESFFYWAIFFVQRETEIQQLDWFLKKQTFLLTIMLLNFCLHGFARTKLPRGKRAKRGASLECRTGRRVKTLPDLNFCYIRMSRV